MLIDELKKANITAMKERNADARAVISVVLTKYKLLEVEATAKGKTLEDADLLGVIQKVLKELSDEKEGYRQVGNLERMEKITNQEKVLSSYLPKQLSEEEIKNIISSLEDKTLPNIMKHFKTNYAGKVDMSLVSRLARNI